MVTQKEIIAEINKLVEASTDEVGLQYALGKIIQLANRIEAEGIAPPHGWQPIETAPRNLQLILVWANFADRLNPVDPASVIYGKGGIQTIVFCDSSGAFIDESGNEYARNGEPENSEFSPYSSLTHWMPLPEPPKGVGNEQ